MKITVSQLRKIIKEEVSQVLGAEKPSVEELYSALRGMCGDDYEEIPASEVVQMLAEDGIMISEDELLATIESREFGNYMSNYDYSLPIGTTEDGKISFANPESN